MIANQRKKALPRQTAIFLLMGDVLIFLGIMACVAILYRIWPHLLQGQNPNAAPPENTAMHGNAESAPQSAPTEGVQTLFRAPASTPESPVSPSASPLPSGAGEAAVALAVSSYGSGENSGDFSATFPGGDTGADAMLHYQGDGLKVAIQKVQQGGVTYFVADVWIRTISLFTTAFANGQYGHSIRQMPLAIANDNHSVFAVTGDYYGARNSGIVIRNGKLYRNVAGDDVCVLRQDGTLTTYPAEEFSALGGETGIWQAWAFGPPLVKNGAVCDTSQSKIKVQNPRCGIGCYAPGHYCFIVVDGRQAGYSDGMTLDAFAKTFAGLGVRDAYNLDGGATAQMIFRGEVVNHPTKGGRAVSDIISFSEGS